MAGFWMADRPDRRSAPVAEAKTSDGPVVPSHLIHETVRAFALHESVAGPLAWYAANEESIRISPASSRHLESTRIVAVLRFRPADQSDPGRQYVIVCREGQPADVRLPDDRSPLKTRVWLRPVLSDGRLKLGYAVTIGEEGAASGLPSVLTGQCSLGQQLKSLGELVVNDDPTRVEAGAWIVAEADL